MSEVGPRQLRLSVLTAFAAVGVAVLAVVTLSGSASPAQGAAPSGNATGGTDGVRAPAAARGGSVAAGPLGAPAAVVVGGVRCPQGAVPAVVFTGAQFSPALARGTSFAPGNYRISLSGTIANESTAPVTVRSVTLKINGVAWTATVNHAGTVPANASVPLTVTGSYRSTGSGPAAVTAALDWQWQTTALQACGEKGLVEDD
jgi:hypothetical protein